MDENQSSLISKIKNYIDIGLKGSILFFSIIYTTFLSVMLYRVFEEISRREISTNTYERAADYQTWSPELYFIIVGSAVFLYPLIVIISLYLIIKKINKIEERLKE